MRRSVRCAACSTTSSGCCVARRDELHARGVRIRGLGRRDERLPQRLRQALEETEALTAANHGMTLTLAIDHDGRAELAAAMAAIAAEVRAGTLRVASIDEDVVAAPSRRPRPPRSRPARAHRGRHPHRELPRLADRLFRVRVHRRPLGRLPARPISSTPSPSSSAANAASAPSSDPIPSIRQSTLAYDGRTTDARGGEGELH